MNPSNTQVTPEIKKVIDSNGDGHTVIPTPHIHAQSEVSGLSTALAGKQNNLTFDSTPTTGSTNPVTSGGVKTALDGKMNNKTIDSTPTANSTNLVTSGGVKTALDGKMNNKTIDSTPTANSTNLVTSGGVKTALDGKANAIPPGSPTGAIVIASTSGETVRSNKTITDLLNAIAAKQDALTFDTTPTANSTNPVTSGGVKTALDGKANAIPPGSPTGAIVIASTSGETVRSNKTITDLLNAIAAKQDALTFDTTPTANSTNPVTSGGVYSALLGKASTAQLLGKEDKPLPLGIHCNDDTAELYPDDRDELYDVFTEVQSKLVQSTSNPKPVHVLLVLSYFDQQGNLSYKCAVNGEMAIWTSGNNVHLSIIIGKSIFVMNGTYSIIEEQGQIECEVTISDETFYYESSI